MKVVISLSGIFFEDATRVKQIAEVLEEIAKSYGLYIVTGGGKIARERIKIARELGANETICDYIGIALTRVNAKLLISALRSAHPEPFSAYNEVAGAGLGEEARISVMGGVSPGYTTDAVAAILAEYVNADLFIDVTSVDGVYDADPRRYPEAKKYDKLTAKELVALTAKEELKAGSRIVIDPVAAKIIERSGIKTIVIDGSNPRDILNAVQGKHHGTVINPE
uniref:Uridylate kinase n=1 Tax=Candidatus Methanophagaceae archaeon ANME-1 ERB6 TaxID=2759912 RepID=A0A7G9YUN2_9EURY|nr:uridylate kinase [Methanosarcinales archaeon ANME-1 ERB6]